MKVSFWLAGEEYELILDPGDLNEFMVAVGKSHHRVRYELLSNKEVLLNIDGRVHTVFIDSNLTSYSISVNGLNIDIGRKAVYQSLGNRGKIQKKKDIKTSMPGKIIGVMVKEGEEVVEGQAVLILEAMKMQNEIRTPQSGRITRIFPKAGDTVEAGVLLFSVE